MKKLSFLTLFSLVVSILHAQNALVKISPFHFIDGTIYTSYEQSFNQQNSFLVSAGYHLTENGDEYGWMGEFQLRKYVVKPSINSSSDSPLSGIYVGLYANGKYFAQQYTTYLSGYEVEPYYTDNFDENGNFIGTTYHQGTGYYSYEKHEKYDVKQVEAGVLMGFQVIMSGNFSLDLFIGGGLRSSGIDNKPKLLEFYSPERGYTGIVPKIGFDVGISF